MQVDLETDGMVDAFVSPFVRPDYSDRVFDLKELLSKRALRWLEAQPELTRPYWLQRFTDSPKHFRSLTYDERSQHAEWMHTRDMTDEGYQAYRQRQRDFVKHMAGVMADQLYATSNRPGFMRRLFAPPEHTVPEGLPQEFKLARRIQSRLKPIRPLREIIQQLHTQRT